MTDYRCPLCGKKGANSEEKCPDCNVNYELRMRIVLMPFVESDILEIKNDAFKGDIGSIISDDAIGSQLIVSSGDDEFKFMISNRGTFLDYAVRILPSFVIDELSCVSFYEIPDISLVEEITEQTLENPLELFVAIQEEIDPDYLFLPEICHFFFRYPNAYIGDRKKGRAFCYVQLMAYLLDNRTNTLASKGFGWGMEYYELPDDEILTDTIRIPLEDQLNCVSKASEKAVGMLLREIKMI